MPGPSSEPVALKLLKGVKPYRINQNEPKPKSVSGAIPKGWALWMSDIAKRFWKRNASRIAAAGVLTEADLDSFRILCELYSSWIQVTNRIRKVGETFKTGTMWKKRSSLASGNCSKK